MNLIALSTGLVLEPRRMWNAFVRGTQSKNLYSTASRISIDAGEWQSVTQLRASVLEVRSPNQVVLAFRGIEFGCYAAAAMAIHAFIAIPALVARLVTDIGLGYNFFQVIKPKKRHDLF
jgi:hypothetical protein